MPSFFMPIASTLVASCLLAGPARAQTPAALPELRTTFQLQGFLPRITSTARIDDWLPATQGTTASGEDDYGLSGNKATLGLAFMRRIGENWRIDIEYLELRRSASNVTLRRDIKAYDRSYTAGTAVSTRMAFNALRVAGGYTLLKQDMAEFGVSLGGIAPRYNVTLSPSGQFWADESGGDIHPSLGVFGALAVSPALRMQGRFEAGPSNRQLNLGGSWRFAANASLGANLRWLDLRIDNTPGDLYTLSTSSATVKLLGPQVVLEVGF